MKGLRVALIHNLKPPSKDPGLPPDYYSECDSPKTVASIARALESGGHAVFPVEADRNLPVWLAHNPVDVAFNIAECFQGESREARVPALLELLEIPHTGSSVLAMALALDKYRSKQIFRHAGIPTPNFQLFVHPDDPLDKHLHFPLIVKPNREGSGKGIWASSVVWEESALRSQVDKVLEAYSQEVLVEEFIDGTELTVGILGADEVLPVLEVDFSECTPSGEFFYSWRMKEFQGNEEMHLTPKFWCPARLNSETTRAVQAVALKASKSLGCRDVSRVDIRLSSDGIPFVLEVNPLPGLDPVESNLPMMCQAAGISYEVLIGRLVSYAAMRCAPTLPKEVAAPSSIPLFQNKKPNTQSPQRRALPETTEKESASPGHPTVVVKRKSPRKDDLKEGDLGR